METDPGLPAMLKRVLSIWSEVLNLKDVKAHDNFFELGGNSMLAVMLAARISEATKVHISLTDLFDFPVAEDFAKRLMILMQLQKEEREEGTL